MLAARLLGSTRCLPALRRQALAAALHTGSRVGLRPQPAAVSDVLAATAALPAWRSAVSRLLPAAAAGRALSGGALVARPPMLLCAGGRSASLLLQQAVGVRGTVMLPAARFCSSLPTASAAAELKDGVPPQTAETPPQLLPGDSSSAKLLAEELEMVLTADKREAFYRSLTYLETDLKKVKDPRATMNRRLMTLFGEKSEELMPLAEAFFFDGRSRTRKEKKKGVGMRMRLVETSELKNLRAALKPEEDGDDAAVVAVSKHEGAALEGEEQDELEWAISQHLADRISYVLSYRQRKTLYALARQATREGSPLEDVLARLRLLLKEKTPFVLPLLDRYLRGEDIRTEMMKKQYLNIRSEGERRAEIAALKEAKAILMRMFATKARTFSHPAEVETLESLLDALKMLTEEQREALDDLFRQYLRKEVRTTGEFTDRARDVLGEMEHMLLPPLQKSLYRISMGAMMDESGGDSTSLSQTVELFLLGRRPHPVHYRARRKVPDDVHFGDLDDVLEDGEYDWDPFGVTDMPMESELGQSRKVYVGNLALDITEDELQDAFRCCGEVERVEIFREDLMSHEEQAEQLREEAAAGDGSAKPRKSKKFLRKLEDESRSPVYGFVHFKSETAAQRALCDPVRLFGMSIKRRMCFTEPAEDKRIIFVGNVDGLMRVGAVADELMAMLGEPLRLSLTSKEPSNARLSSTHCYIEFDSHEQADAAVKQLAGQNVTDRPLRVGWALWKRRREFRPLFPEGISWSTSDVPKSAEAAAAAAMPGEAAADEEGNPLFDELPAMDGELADAVEPPDEELFASRAVSLSSPSIDELQALSKLDTAALDQVSVLDRAVAIEQEEETRLSDEDSDLLSSGSVFADSFEGEDAVAGGLAEELTADDGLAESGAEGEDDSEWGDHWWSR